MEIPDGICMDVKGGNRKVVLGICVHALGWIQRSVGLCWVSDFKLAYSVSR